MEDQTVMYQHARHTYHELLATLSTAYQHPHIDGAHEIARGSEEGLSRLEAIFPELIFDFS